MKERARERRDDARRHRDAGDLERAGDEYTSSAHEYAGTTGHTFPEPDATPLVLGALLDAATCYRIAGDDRRTQNRCGMGTLVAEERRAYADERDFEPGSFADLRRGAWPEFVGDLRMVPERPDVDDAYDRAVSMYKSASDFDFVYAEQEHTRLASYFRSVRSGVGQGITPDDPEQLDPGVSFSKWVEYKRTRLPDLLEKLQQRGEWPVG